MQSSPRAATSRMARTGHTNARIYTKLCICRRRFDQQQPTQTTAHHSASCANATLEAQCTAGDGGLMYCCGWSRRGEARRLQWHQLRHHTYQRAVEDRRGRDANAAEEVQRACSCCMAPDYQRLTLSHTMPPSLPPCNPPLPYNHLV